MRKPEVIIGQKASLKLNWKLDETIALGTGNSFKVVGVYATGSRLFDTGMIMSIGDASRVLNRRGEINITLIRPQKGYAIQKLLRG